MLVGRGHAKGSAFERDTCRRLSKWLTNGKRDDLLARNVLSGGQFTQAHRRGVLRGSPGDLTAIDPLAIEFIQVFSVECKHYKYLGLDTYAFDRTGSCLINQWISLCKKQAKLANKQWVLVAKQNLRDALIFMEPRTAIIALRCLNNSRTPLGRVCHTYNVDTKREATMMFFDDFLKHVNPKQFIKDMDDGTRTS